MEFTLVYQGPLKSNGSAKHKHEIRCQLQPQLEVLWSQPPLKQLGESFYLNPGFRGVEKALKLYDIGDEPSFHWREIEGVLFYPVVSEYLSFVCALHVLLLRPGLPGQVVHGGDLDNRMKTLLDALTIPDPNQVRALGAELAGEEQIYCLLADDRLITDLRVESDRLLDPEADPKSVVAVIRVRIRSTDDVPIRRRHLL